LTVKDAALDLTKAEADSVTGRTITFDYAGATTSKTLSAIVRESSGKVKYYGRLVVLTTDQGNADVTVPDDFAAADELRIFVEEINDGNKTDFAGEPTKLTGFTAQPEPIGLVGIACTTPANDDGQITGTTTNMEYRKDGGQSWMTCADTAVTSLTPGDYFVRAIGDASSKIIDSAPVKVTVGAYADPVTDSTAGNSDSHICGVFGGGFGVFGVLAAAGLALARRKRRRERGL